MEKGVGADPQTFITGTHRFQGAALTENGGMVHTCRIFKECTSMLQRYTGSAKTWCLERDLELTRAVKAEGDVVEGGHLESEGNL